jgi:excisionase family DNA binding protein
MHATDLEGALQGAQGIRQFCDAWNIGKTFVYAQIKSGKLRSVKCGKRTLILRADAERWARSLPQKGASHGRD